MIELGDSGCDQLLPDLALVDDLDPAFFGFGEFAGADIGAGDEQVGVGRDGGGGGGAGLFAESLEGGARDFLAGAWVADRAGDHDGFAGQGRAGGDDGWEVFLADVQGYATLPQPLQFGPQPGEVLDQGGGDLRPDVLDSHEPLFAGVGDLLERAEPRAAQPCGGALGGHRDGQPDQRPAQADLAAGVDRLDHARGGDVTDAVELQQPLLGEGIEV